MKKIIYIILNICIVFLIAFFIYLLVKEFQALPRRYKLVDDCLNAVEYCKKTDSASLEAAEYELSIARKILTDSNVFISLYSISLAAMGFIFVYCNPRLFRLSTWTNLSEEWKKNKDERTAVKQAKAEADKQKRIEELQAKIDELNSSNYKKD